MDPRLPLSTSILGRSLQFGNATAPLFFVSGSQVILQVRWELVDRSQTTLAVTLNGRSGAGQTVNLAPVAPGVFRD